MDFNILISELRSSAEGLSSDTGDKSLLSSNYCTNACKALQRVTESDSDYDSIITGLWLIVAHFAEQSGYLKTVPALSELCFKLFRQCAKAILNIQWQNLDEDSSVRQNFLISIDNLHAKLVPFDFPRFGLLKTLAENPWANPTLAKIMGGEVEASDKEEVHNYIQQEDSIILQLRVEMMLQENCEEYALNLNTSSLKHPELASDLSHRITQLSLLHKMGNEDKLQEECQRLSIQEALRVIKELNNSGKQKELYTVLAQTFMVQNWIRPGDLDTSKELLRMWIRHQLLVDREHDQFKDSIWAMAKLSHSTEQIVIIIDVLREECGDTFLQLYVDMSIFALKVDKGQMETSIKENNMEAAAARRADMASVCTKLSCLCHHASNKVGKICALTSFALRPTQESFNKIGAFYGQGGDCCDKCGCGDKREENAINPATLYEVERLLNMLRPDYLNPDNTYPHIHVMCRSFLLESLRNAQAGQKKPASKPNGDNSGITQVEGPGRKKPGANKATIVFEALSPKDVQDRQALLAILRMQNPANLQPNPSFPSRASYTKTSPASLKSKDGFVSGSSNKISTHQRQQHLLNQQELYRRRLQQQLEKQGGAAMLSQAKPPFKQPASASPHSQAMQTQQVSQLIQLALKDPVALQQISKAAPAAVAQVIANMVKGTHVRSFSQQQQLTDTQSSVQEGGQSLPTVSTLLKSPTSSPQQPQVRQQPVPRRRPQLYAQPIVVSSGASSTMTQGRFHSQPASLEPTQLSSHGLGISQRGLPVTSQEQQRAESLSISKNHVQGVRQFMQSQLSALQAGQTSQTSSYGVLSGRVKTTVELAQQAALKKQQKQARLSQDPTAFPGIRISSSSGMPPVIGTINRQPHQEMHSAHQGVRQQLYPRQSSANIFSNVEGSFQSPQNSSGTSVLPSSDELLGSITGIDDTIINDLLQDSGLLSNTFPDIEVDVSGEDRGRISSTFGQPAAGQTNSRAGSSYQNNQSLSRSMLATLSRVSTSGHTHQSKAETVSVFPQKLQFQRPQTSSVSNHSVHQQSASYGQQASTQGPLQSPISIASAEQARMDQINQQMKQEDIPGEMCMDAANNATYRCILCSLAFETLDLLREHVRNVCKPGLQSSSVYTSKIEQDKANSAKAGLETTTVFQCLRCFELCISEAGIKQHRLTCKRVPTIPSDIKKEAAAASASKSKSRSSNKHGSVKGESRPHSRNNTSVLSSHTSQRASSAALQSISTGSGVAVKLETYQPQQVKSEPQAQGFPASMKQSTTAPAFVSQAAFSPHISNVSQAGPSPACLPSQLSLRSPSNFSTLASSLPLSLAANSHSSKSVSRDPPEKVYPMSSCHPPLSAGKHCVSSTPPLAVDQDCKADTPNSSLNTIAVQPNLNSEPKNELCPDSKDTFDISSPKYSEISGSGGSKFYKCDLCSQTLCSSSSFINHWKECTLRHKTVNKKKMRKEKVPAEPLQGKLLENVINVIQSVASGNFDKSGQLLGMDREEVVKLRDPCLDQAHDTASSVEGADSEVSWDSRATFDNATDSEPDKSNCVTKSKQIIKKRNSQLKMISEGQGIEPLPTGSEEKDSGARDSQKANCSKVGTGSEEEDDASLSGSESGSSTLHSRREAPPKLRDRKLLKPIQSFINETFISPYQHFSKRLAKVVEESVVSEGTTSGAESDEDHRICVACKKPLQSQRLLLEHYVSEHLKPYTVKTVSDSSSYFCHLCQKTFSTFSLYKKHVPNHSSTITQKMKIFSKSPRMSLHRDRLVSPNGLGRTKKKNLSPKLAKALKSKKSATKSAAYRIKRQMLIMKGQFPPERLKIFNRQRNSFRTSSEDDYSSDASNLMFKPRKPILMIRGPDGKYVRRKRGRPRKDLLPEDIVPADQIETEESQQTSSSNTADEDYVASDGNSDATGPASPPSTRSRKRSGNFESPAPNDVKRRRHFSDSEGLTQLHRKDAFLSDFDTDSNSTTLSISVQENGCIVPSSRNKTKSEVMEEGEISEKNCCEKLGILNKLKVSSLSRRQKEKLKKCDLNPSVILDALDLDSLCLQGAKSEISQSNSLSEREEAPASEAALKRPTFLDSYLSYINSYQNSPSKQWSYKKSLKQARAVSLTDLKKAEQSTPTMSLNATLSISSTDVKDQSSEASDVETEERPSSSQSDNSWKNSVRRCSVNLGQKIPLSDEKSETHEEIEGDDCELATLVSQKPVVCLERNAKVENCVISNILTAVVDPDTGFISDTAKDQILNTNSPGTCRSKTFEENSVLDKNMPGFICCTNKVNIQDKGLNDSNSVTQCLASTTVDNFKSGVPKGVEVVQSTSSTESNLSLTCPFKENKKVEENVVLFVPSDEEEKAAQDDLKDMVIIVNNDVEDDENDDDVVQVNEEKPINTSQFEGKADSSAQTQSLAALAFQTDKPKESNGPKPNQTPFTCNSSDNVEDLNTTEDGKSSSQERSCLNACNGAEIGGEKSERLNNLKDANAGQKCVDVEVLKQVNSEDNGKCIELGCSVADSHSQSFKQKTTVTSPLKADLNTAVVSESSFASEETKDIVDLPDQVKGGAVTSTFSKETDGDIDCLTNCKAYEGQASFVGNKEKESFKDGKEIDRPVDDRLDTLTEGQITAVDVNVTGEESTVPTIDHTLDCSNALVRQEDGSRQEAYSTESQESVVRNSSDTLAGPDGKAVQDQASSESPEIVVKSNMERLSETVSQLEMPLFEQNSKTVETTSGPSKHEDKHIGGGNMEGLGNQRGEVNKNSPASHEQSTPNKNIIVLCNDDAKPEEIQSENEVIHLESNNLLSNQCSEEALGQGFDGSVQKHSGSLNPTAVFVEKVKTFDDGKIITCLPNSTNELEKSFETHRPDLDVIKSSERYPNDQIGASESYVMDNKLKAAYENPKRDTSSIKQNVISKDTKDTTTIATGFWMSPYSDNVPHPKGLVHSKAREGTDTTPEEDKAAESKLFLDSQDMLSEDPVQDDLNHGSLTRETGDTNFRVTKSGGGDDKDQPKEPDSGSGPTYKQIPATTYKQIPATNSITSNICPGKEDLKMDSSKFVAEVTDIHADVEEEVKYQTKSSASKSSKISLEVSQTANNNKKPDNKKVSKAPRKPDMMAFKNAHKSVALFIAERLQTTKTDNQNNSALDDPQNHPGMVKSVQVLYEDDPTKSEKTLENKFPEPSPNDNIDDVLSAIEKPLQDSVVSVGEDEPKKKVEVQDINNALGVGLVDYSCSSEENSRDGDKTFSKSGLTDDSNQVPSIQCESEAAVSISLQKSPQLSDLDLGLASVASKAAVTIDQQKSPQPGKDSDLGPGSESSQVSLSSVTELHAEASNSYKESLNCCELNKETINSKEVEIVFIANESEIFEKEASGHVIGSSVDRSIPIDSGTFNQNEFEEQNVESFALATSTNGEDELRCEESTFYQTEDHNNTEQDAVMAEIKTNDQTEVQILEKQPGELAFSIQNNDEISKKIFSTASAPDQMLNPDFNGDGASGADSKSNSEQESKNIERKKTVIESPALPDLDTQEKTEKQASLPNIEYTKVDEGDKEEVIDTQRLTDMEKLDDQSETFKVMDDKKTSPPLPQPASPSYPLQANPRTKSPTPKKKSSLETSYDTDDGDDLSSFELVIEADTSSRSVLTFPERRNDQVTPQPLKEKEKMAGFVSDHIQDSPEARTTGTPQVGLTQKQVYNPSTKKALRGAKSLREGGKFVWEDDSDEDNRPISGSSSAVKTKGPESQQTVSKIAPGPAQQQKPAAVIELLSKRKAVEDSSLDPVKRKRKALRDKTETAPFTWDLEDNADKANGPRRVLSVKDPTLLREAQMVNRKSSKAKAKQALDAKRPSNPKVIALSRKKAKAGQTGPSPVPPSNKTVSESAKSITKMEGVENANDNNIQVDQILSKRGSLPSTPKDSPVTETPLNSANRKVRRSRPGNTTAHTDAKSSPMSERKNGELSPKSQSSLRSRHSSVESNRSDTSTASATRASKRRGQKGEEAYLSKAGLIKVGNAPSPAQVVPTHNGPAAPKDASTHNTRSSEAAVKAYNQKSLRNRGVNPLLTNKHSVSDKRASASPPIKMENVGGQSKTPFIASPVQVKSSLPLIKTPAAKPAQRPIKRKSDSLQTSQDQTAKKLEVVTPKPKKRAPSDSKSEEVKKAKLQSGLIKPKRKTLSSVLKKASGVKQAVGKANSVSTVVHKAKSMVVKKAKSVTSVVRKSKTLSLAVRKTKNGPKSTSKAKPVSSSAIRTKTATASKKPGVSLARKTPKKENKSEANSKAKVLLKKATVKGKNNSAAKKTLAEKKTGFKK